MGVLGKGKFLQGNIRYYEDYENKSYSYTPIENKDTEIQKKESVSVVVKEYKLPKSAVLFIFGKSATSSLFSLSHAAKKRELFPICISLIWL